MRKWIERFTGFTLGINPIFTVIGLLMMSISSTKGMLNKIRQDRISLLLWAGLALSGIISVIFAVNLSVAVSSYLIPFVFIWLYCLGRWGVERPERFLRDFLRGVALLALIATVAEHYRLSWSIGEVRILSQFRYYWERGEILYVANNALGLFFQAGVVGALGKLFVEKKKVSSLVENLLIMGLCISGLVISSSRGAMVGVLSAGLYLGIDYSLYVVLSLGIFAAALVKFAGERFLSAFSLLEHSTRIKIWMDSLKIWKDHFWFGIGPGNFGQVYPKYKNPTLEIDPTCAHSNYLNIFLGWGLIGGLFFWGWHLFVFIRAFRRKLTPLQKVIVAILISYFTHVAVNELFAAYSGFLLGLLDHAYFQQKEEVVNA